MSPRFAPSPRTGSRDRAPVPWVRRVAAAAAVAGVLLTVAGCTNSSAASAASSMSSAAAPAADLSAGAAMSSSAGAAPAASAAAGAGAAAAGSATATARASGGKDAAPIDVGVDPAERQVIRTANLTLDVVVTSLNTTAAADQEREEAKVGAAAENVRRLATGTGYVSAAQGKGTTQSITLRVPAAGYDNVISALAGIAPIVSRQESTEDVTAKMVDIGSRMQTMTASVSRVRALLSKAEKIGDVISIESELSAREADLESLQRQQAALAGQTALSTITVVVQGSISGVKPTVAPVASARSGFTGGLANGWDAVRHLGHAGLTVVGTLLPFVPLVGVVVLGWLYLRRRFRPGVPPVLPPGRDPQPAE